MVNVLNDYASSYGDARTIIRQICGDKIADQCKDVWGLDAEGEMNGSWRDMGVPGLWYAMGELSFANDSTSTSNSPWMPR